MAPSCSSERNASSANIAFTRSWQSSNVPSTATLCTFGSSTVVICRRWTSLTRPAGCNTTMSRFALPTHAAIAAEPVSPDVATTIVRRSPRRSSSASMSRPTSWSATSLNDSVGPCQSSCTQMSRSASSWTSGHTSLWSKVAYASATRSASTPVMSVATSAYERGQFAGKLRQRRRARRARRRRRALRALRLRSRARAHDRAC